jgi:hypothetical protein
VVLFAKTQSPLCTHPIKRDSQYSIRRKIPNALRRHYDLTEIVKLSARVSVEKPNSLAALGEQSSMKRCSHGATLTAAATVALDDAFTAPPGYKAAMLTR